MFFASGRLDLKPFFSKLSHSLLHSEYIDFLKPLIWPRHSTLLRALVVASFLVVGAGLVVNLYVPIYTQIIVDLLLYATENEEGISLSLFRTLLIFLTLKLLQGVGPLSLLNTIQNLLWIKLGQNAHKSIQVQFFSHLHQRSIGWQLSQKAGDLLKTLERGSAAATSIIEISIYSILQTVANILIAVVFLSLKFSATIGLIVLLQTFSYVWTTLKCAEWRSRYQKGLNEAENEQTQRAMESLLNFETVKLFCNEEHETTEYSAAIDRVQKQELAVQTSLNVMQLIQLGIVHLGLFIGTLITVSLILNDKKLAVGDYVLFMAYMGQLILPLNFLGVQYRMIRTSLANLECMMKFLKTSPGLSKRTKENDKLTITNGVIELRDVCFSYSENKPVLRGASFTIPAKKSIALVGESGSGKSTVIRLLTKLYDTNAGQVLIDGQNLTNCRPSAVRQLIGVVPQDTILFHDTIRNNIKYSKLDATEYEIVLAAQRAQIHDKIMSLDKKYDTMVGNRGLKLSGGEKGRIAIARMFLQNPPILLLDEATSSLDARTEAEIMSSFNHLCLNRTSLIVTHRLQTLINVDKICVLKNGVIIESGTHEELVKLQGEYYGMWKQQVRS